jgi:hypothetical protein
MDLKLLPSEGKLVKKNYCKINVIKALQGKRLDLVRDKLDEMGEIRDKLQG